MAACAKAEFSRRFTIDVRTTNAAVWAAGDAEEVLSASESDDDVAIRFRQSKQDLSFVQPFLHFIHRRHRNMADGIKELNEVPPGIEKSESTSDRSS